MFRFAVSRLSSLPWFASMYSNLIRKRLRLNNGCDCVGQSLLIFGLSAEIFPDRCCRGRRLRRFLLLRRRLGAETFPERRQPSDRSGRQLCRLLFLLRVRRHLLARRGSALCLLGFLCQVQLPFCRTVDRINPARGCGSYRGLGRGTFAPNLAGVCSLLQQHQNASVTGQRCARLSLCSAGRNHHVICDPRSTLSPLHLGFRYTRYRRNASEIVISNKRACSCSSSGREDTRQSQPTGSRKGRESKSPGAAGN
jgi:hypothetical protein